MPDLHIPLSLFFFIILLHKYAFLNTIVLPVSEIYEKRKFYVWLLLVNLTLMRFIEVKIWAGNNKRNLNITVNSPLKSLVDFFLTNGLKISNYYVFFHF